MLNFLENRKENRSWYKGSRVTLAVSNLFIFDNALQCWVLDLIRSHLGFSLGS